VYSLVAILGSNYSIKINHVTDDLFVYFNIVGSVFWIIFLFALVILYKCFIILLHFTHETLTLTFNLLYAIDVSRSIISRMPNFQEQIKSLGTVSARIVLSRLQLTGISKFIDQKNSFCFVSERLFECLSEWMIYIKQAGYVLSPIDLVDVTLGIAFRRTLLYVFFVFV